MALHYVGNAGESFEETVYHVKEIHDDAWSYGHSVGSGDFSLHMNSTMIRGTAHFGKGAFYMNSGPIALQVFAGNYLPMGPRELYVGAGDYSNLFDAERPSVTLTANNDDNSFKLESMSFGNIKFDSNGAPSSGSFVDLTQVDSAIVAPNFQGLGLPDYLWSQVTDQLSQLDHKFKCNDEHGGICRLPLPCEKYAELWSSGYSFKLKFAGEDNYVIMPLGALATDYPTCTLFMQQLDEYQHS
jgi:hypothetical protein